MMNGMRKKILIVDDEKISLMMTEHIISSEYETITASSGEEAIHYYAEKRPDLILSDLRMPGMTGMELQQYLIENYGDETPFIFMTADQDEETEVEGLKQGAKDFIHKPFRADVLLKRISNILSMVEQIRGFKRASETDPMTGLLNKASAQQEIRELCQKTSGALLMVDLDSFKPVNDLYGHAMGDQILIRFSEILKSAVRHTDLTGRIGGDEFIAYCQNVGEESVIAEKTAYINENIIESAREILGKDMSIPLGASIGCVFVPDEGVHFHELFQKADKALYEVKKNGKHGYQIFRSLTHNKEEAEVSASGIAEIAEILSERNPKKGAYVLPFEQFRTVYRFFVRLVANYKKEIWILLFSLKEVENPSLTMEEAMERFLPVLSSSLRQSDVVTKSSRNQALAILSETNRGNSAAVIERIRNNWKKTGADTGYEFTCELDKIS